MKSYRQNFLIPIALKNHLDKEVPKGKQSKFVAEAIEERLAEKKSWSVLDAPALLGMNEPLTVSANLRKSWRRE